MPRSADADIEMVDGFVPKVALAVKKLENLSEKLKSDPQFRALYESDFIAALKSVGIDPNARTEMGLPPLQKDNIPARSKSCITPMGHACVCCPDVAPKSP